MSCCHCIIPKDFKFTCTSRIIRKGFGIYCGNNKYFGEAKRAIEYGVHCLIEKPIRLTVKEGKELVNLLDNSGLIAGVGHIERFNPIVEEINEIINNPLYVEIRRHNPASARITDSSIVEERKNSQLKVIL